MSFDFDEKLSDLKMMISEFKAGKNLSVQGLLLDACYDKLNGMLRDTKAQRTQSLSQLSKILKQKTILEKAHTDFLQELNFCTLVRNATELDQLYRKSVCDKGQIKPLVEQIKNAADNIDLERLTTKEKKLYHDALQLAICKKKVSCKASFSDNMDDEMTQKIQSLEDDDQFKEIVLSSQELTRQSFELVNGLDIYSEIKQEHIDQSALEQKLIEANSLIFTQNLIIRQFMTVIDLISPVVLKVIRMFKWVYKKVSGQNTENQLQVQ